MSRSDAKRSAKVKARQNAAVNLAVVAPKSEATWQEIWDYAHKKAVELNKSWVSLEVRTAVVKRYPELKLPGVARPDEIQWYIDSDKGGRSWITRRAKYGPSGYKAGHAPWAGRRRPGRTSRKGNGNSFADLD